MPTVGLVGTYLLLLFPDGKLPSKRWRLLAWISGAVIVLLSITGIFAPGPLQNLGGYATRSGSKDTPG
jgi:two-component system, NarL family, sensor kinase